MDRMLTMIIRMALRPLITKGLNAGIDRMSRGSGGARGEAMTPEDRASAQRGQQNTRQMMGTLRKLSRFTRF